MSAIDKQRIVAKDEEELDEFICCICHNILNEPLVTQCCRQTFCKVCITQWLNISKSCPNDCKDLTIDQLVSPPRNLVNLLNKLRIKCEFHEKGCDVVLTIDEMRQHLNVCPKNFRGLIRYKCGLDESTLQWLIGQIVVCVNSEKDLTKLVEAIYNKIKMNELLDNYMFSITTIKKRTGCGLHSFPNLCLDIELDGLFIRVMGFKKHPTQREVIKSANDSQNPTIIKEYGFSESTIQWIIEQAKECVKSQDTYLRISEAIHKKIQSNVSLKDNSFIVLINTKGYEDNSFASYNLRLKFNLGDLAVSIFGIKRIK